MRKFLIFLCVGLLGFSAMFSSCARYEDLSVEEWQMVRQERAEYLEMAVIAAREAYNIYLQEVARQEDRDFEEEQRNRQRMLENIELLEGMLDRLDVDSEGEQEDVQ